MECPSNVGIPAIRHPIKSHRAKYSCWRLAEEKEEATTGFKTRIVTRNVSEGEIHAGLTDSLADAAGYF